MCWNFLGISLFKPNGFGRSFLHLFFGFGFICTRSICFSSQWNLGFCGTIKIVLCCDLGLYLPFLTWKFLMSLLRLLLYMFWFFSSQMKIETICYEEYSEKNDKHCCYNISVELKAIRFCPWALLINFQRWQLFYQLMKGTIPDHCQLCEDNKNYFLYCWRVRHGIYC